MMLPPNRKRRVVPPAGRRAFLQALASGLAVGPATACEPYGVKNRLARCYQLRIAAATAHSQESTPQHRANGDERLFPEGAASFSKGLRHGSPGEPAPGSYATLVAALCSGKFSSLENVPLGGELKLSNPLAGNAFEMEGPDSRQIPIPPPPTCASAVQAGEMAQLYWQAIARDVPFARWDRDPVIGAAIGDLSTYFGLDLNAQTLFRLPGKGVMEGPYVSQFLLAAHPFGNMTVDQRYLAPEPGQNFGTDYGDWLALQNGTPSAARAQIENNRRYLATPRALAGYVHRDDALQSFLGAALILATFGEDAWSDANPYRRSKTQAGFVTFGLPHAINAITRAANAARRAAWFQKWQLHRRIRPEEYAARVHHTIANRVSYPVHGDLLRSAALDLTHFARGTYLLPQAYPEGRPAHPSYPGGAAAVAGACATMLKAFFRESFLMPQPVVSDMNGLALLPFQGALTAGGEINKLAANIATARDWAGVHWRSDSLEGIRLGEAVAIGILRDSPAMLPEPFAGFSFHGFDGDRFVIS